MPKFTPELIGTAEIAGGAAIAAFSGGVLTPLASMLIAAGAGQVFSGLGTLLSKGPVNGFATTVRDPVAPWEYVYGQVRQGGAIVYENSWPQAESSGVYGVVDSLFGGSGNDVMLDLVIVLAAHACQSIDAVLFDQQRVQIDVTSGTCSTDGTAVTWAGGASQFAGAGILPGYPFQINGANYTIASVPSPTSIILTTSAGVQTSVPYIGAGSAPAGAPIGSGTSFSPAQQTVNIASIQRVNNVVTVTLNSNIPYLIEGDNIRIQNITGDPTLNGTFPVAQILSQSDSGIVFTYLSGGSPSLVDNQGQAATVWANYGRSVYFEPLLGNQVLGETFAGMLGGTPLDGDMNSFTQPNATGAVQGADSPNPWTQYCSLQGKTAVFLRLHFSSQYYPATIPQISFLMHGKNDIVDPRSSPATQGYSNNAALCIADFLADTELGYSCEYSADIPLAYLISAANVCDEPVTLAIGGSPPATEPAYTCNGKFPATMKRGEVLENMLTSCAGRLTTFGGQFIIWPAAWVGNSFAIGSDPGGGVTALGNFGAAPNDIAAGPISWKGASIRDLYNGVKGTYIAQPNKWVSGDFPPYCQDALHGYDGPSMYGGDINLAYDGGGRRWLDIQLPFTTSASMAQRIAKIELLRRRWSGAGPRWSGTFPLTMAAYQMAPMDLLLATIPVMGWGAGSPSIPKQLEMLDARLRVEQGGDEGPRLVYEVDVQEIDSTVYDWSTEEELSPQGYVQPALPGAGYYDFFANETVPGFNVPFPWEPGDVLPLLGDALEPGPVVGPPPSENQGRASFGLHVAYGTDAMGNATSSMNINGDVPANDLSDFPLPQIVSAAAGTGGQLKTGVTYIVAVSAVDELFNETALSVPFKVTIPQSSPTGANNGSINLVTSAWPSNGFSTASGLNVYLAEATTAAGYFFQATLTDAATTLTITDFDQSTGGAPDATFDHLAIAWKKVIHGGVWAQQVQAVTADTITIGGAGMDVNQWQGYTLTLLGKLDSTQPLIILNMPVSSSTASSSPGAEFMLTIGPNANGDQLPDLTTLLVPGDLVVMRMNPTFTAQSFYDPNIANAYYPNGADDVEAGFIAMVLTGVDAGDAVPIASVSTDSFGNSTIFELANPWAIQPNTGDIVIVVEAVWGPEWHTHALASPNRDALGGVLVGSPPVTNLASQTWVFIVRAQTVDDDNGLDRYAPVREVYIFGSQGTRTLYGASPAAVYEGLPTDRILDFDCTAGSVYYFLPLFSEIQNQGIYLQKIDDSPNPVVWFTSGSPPEDTVNGQTSGQLLEQWDYVDILVSGS